MFRFLLRPAVLLGFVVMGLTAAAFLYGHMLPPGTQFAVVTHDRSHNRVQLNEPRHVCEVTLAGLPDGPPRRSLLAWSPDGRRLVVQQRKPGVAASDVLVIDAATRRTVCQMNLPLSTLGGIHWQADGGGFLLAGELTAPGSRDYGYVSLADCTLHSLETLDWQPFPKRVTWSAQTGRFYLVDRRVHTLDPQTGNCSNMTDWLQADLYWSDDGTRLLQIVSRAACDDGEPPQIRAYWLADDQLLAQVEAAMPDDFPIASDYDWSPDGTQILAFGWGTERGELCFINAATLESRCVRPTHPVATYTWAWSPDSTQIAYVTGAIPAEDADIALVDVATGRSRQLTDTPTIDEHLPQWSPDGRYVQVRAHALDTGRDTTRILDARTGETVLVVPGDALAWRPGR